MDDAANIGLICLLMGLGVVATVAILLLFLFLESFLD
jgi:hypothetical protein